MGDRAKVESPDLHGLVVQWEREARRVFWRSLWIVIRRRRR